jgi:uncharacterized YigZ family protein
LKFVREEFCHTLEIKKSKFIAHLVTYDNHISTMKKLKQLHSKARHFVYAYRYLNKFDQIVENCSDDGEPKGTSGKPSLNVLRGANIINSSVIIVRYFGGTKLGTGGLVKAYSEVVNQVCKNAIFVEYKNMINKEITVHYSDLSKVEYKLKQLNIQIIKKEFNHNVILTLSATEDEFNRYFLFPKIY